MRDICNHIYCYPKTGENVYCSTSDPVVHIVKKLKASAREKGRMNVELYVCLLSLGMFVNSCMFVIFVMYCYDVIDPIHYSYPKEILLYKNILYFLLRVLEIAPVREMPLSRRYESVSREYDAVKSGGRNHYHV